MSRSIAGCYGVGWSIAEGCRVFISVGYGFLELRTVAKCFFMFLSVFDFSECFLVFQSISLCFCMFLHVSACFCVFLSVSELCEVFMNLAECFLVFLTVAECFGFLGAFLSVSLCF